jgi:hypothetical protein
MEKFNRTAQMLIDALLTDHPDWRPYALPYGPADDREADEHSVRFSVPVPREGRHRLEVALRGNTIEVAYDCGEAVGPRPIAMTSGSRSEGIGR